MRKLLLSVGPGLLFAGAAIGVSHLVQSTRAGAEYGLGLFWALILAHLFKYPFFQFGPRYALATGESLLDGYRKLGKGVLIAYFLLTLATMFTIQTAVTIVTAGLASSLFGITTNPVIWSVIITLICLIILLIGKYKILDRLMKVIVFTLTLCTIVAVIMAAGVSDTTISWTQILPKETASIAFLIAFMGWMPAPLDLSVWHSLWVLEKKKISEDYRDRKVLADFNIGYLSTILLGILFICLGMFVMYGSGKTFAPGASQFAEQFIGLYTATLGKNTFLIIALAGFTAMFSTTLTTLDASPRSMERASEILLKGSNPFNFLFWIIILATGTGIILMFFLSEMKLLIDIATILSFVTAPFYAVINYALMCSRYMPEAWKLRWPMHILSWISIISLTGFSIWYLTTI
ncbi:Nramp family divalent metal transporter [Robertkochia solimangrovi]|uniref:Nramp family divalent metal transporter n=1 Tax=Robertkochia solimangrovi TaxID=2213046 RepID=UPI001180A208|nr:Nramp family divalent metal transporter [Robertkochia solimangrovi]TRZ41438.1 divalent metal cation transporter [Robertkochia solimangrovi]